MKKFISILVSLMLIAAAILPFSSGANAKTKKIAIKSIKLSTTIYTYNGKVRKPSVTVKDSKGSVVKRTNYSVTYSSGRKNVGTYKVTVKAKSKKYTGTKTATFKIIPKGTSISSLTPQVKGLTVKYKKVTTQTSGYKVRISSKSSMSGAVTYTIYSPETTTKKITGLAEGKKYYVQVCTYKTVSKKTYCSTWSTKKFITTQAAASEPIPEPDSEPPKGWSLSDWFRYLLTHGITYVPEQP